ncbi:Regulator of rDNA transcription protein 15 [Capsicum annuum]|uniref:Regulator of rDNA transcription protein 15 n=1 Tax=Capsicum annuum TaxID=4072 RepID=A0A2G2ZT31_CAPAN|nr:Regulator of rDNA transcription protein 15 [Capsicum annuum]
MKGEMRCVTPRQKYPRPNGFGGNLHLKTRWFTRFCNSQQASHFATFFIDTRAKISVVESHFYLQKKHRGMRAGDEAEVLVRSAIAPARVDSSVVKHVRGSFCCAGFDNNPSTGSHMETLLRLLLSLNDKVQWTSRNVAGSEPPTSPRSKHFTGSFNCALVAWCDGAMVPRCYGALVPWFHGALVPRCLGATVPWCLGATVPWCLGALVPWRHGALVTWSHGAMVPLCHGATVPWCIRATVPWCYGAFVPWYHGALLPGAMVLWCHGALVHDATVPWCLGATVPRCLGALVPWCLGTLVPWGDGPGTRISNLTKTPPWSKGSLSHAFTVNIHTGNQNQTSFYPSVPYDISVLVELILGHLYYLLTDVLPQPNSPPDNVFHPDRPTERALDPKRGAVPHFRFTKKVN